MSGKPASVGASRAGAPRLLVYVAERPLDDAPPPPDDSHHPPLALPRGAVCRPDHAEHRNLPPAIYYKPHHQPDRKLTYGFDGAHPEFYSLPQSYKETCLKVDNNRGEVIAENLKQNIEQIGLEYGVESFHSKVPIETDVAYHTRCSVPGGPPDNMVPTPAIHHTQSQYSESVVNGEGLNCSDREVVGGKSYMNYQFLEQSVSHQSIVNQSISILNQHVGVRSIVSEGDGGTPQLVRTAEGVVLAVVPAPVAPTDSPELVSRTVNCDQTITVPLGWRRIINGTSVLYISPSGTALSTLTQLREYLQTTGTCKCGLPCPLRPETAFSFDSKVASKPYQVASGAELTKLCNHKRKLLATLQARAHSPATPPPQNIDHKKAVGAEVGVIKKKMKKRTGFPAHANVSHLMMQKESINEFKLQDLEANREVSGIITQRPNNVQSGIPTFTQQQNVLNAQDNDVKQEPHAPRTSHYLTVNSGWITHHSENLHGGQKNVLTTAPPVNVNVGLPVLGTNGQIIGVNTGYKKHPSNSKNTTAIHYQNKLDVEKDKRKDLMSQPNVKFPLKEEESQIFCGLNQPLTPEVMQKINEQQQIFIQQNQKQIEIAMKGLQTQITDNTTSKTSVQQQYVPQGQLVIQNGAVVKTNPAKTPPWQVKKTDSSPLNQISTSPNLKLQKESVIEFEESTTNLSEDSSSSYSSFSSNEQNINQMCSRVPPLPQHYTMMSQQWPNVDSNKKKVKNNNNKGAKKKNSPIENKILTFGNNGMRLVQDTKGNVCEEMPNNNIPSFMEDPNGYLAQQTALLNNTISRQVGMSSTYESQYESSNNTNCYMSHSQTDKTKAINKSPEMSNMHRNNVPNPSISPNNTPDSSMISDKIENTLTQCCKGCNVPATKRNSPEYSENHIRFKYMKHNIFKTDNDSNASTLSPRHAFEDNPVTSSTFIDRSPLVNDSSGPIQAGTISTSSVTDTLQPPEPSPTLSNSSRSTDTPHSGGSNNSQMQPSLYPVQSPVYSNSGKDNFSNPSTPGSQPYPYNSPGPPSGQSISGTQMMHFISNHNVNKNLMEVDNISMVGIKPNLRGSQEPFRLDRRRLENSMPGYCPPPHLGSGPAHSLIQSCYVQTFVTTMASGFSVTRDTVTSVLAGKANTATTSINASQANFIRLPPPPSVNMANTYAIPNNQPDPFINSVNLPTSYPLHIAGTTAQNMISKSPLEMVQNVIGSLPIKSETGTQPSTSTSLIRRTTPGQILISSTGQIIVSNSQMPPPPPKTTTTMSSIQCSNPGTNVSASVSQVVPSIVNQPTVVVNTLPTPFVIQPPMMAVDGQVLPQNAVLPQIMSGGVLPSQSPSENVRQIDVKTHQSFVQGMAMLSPESLKKRNKKKKNQNNITNVLQITAPQQNPNNIMVHHSSPQHNTSPQFSPRSFQLSPNNNISPTPMLQALTIVPGKSGTPAHIVMNGQSNTSNYGSQQIIANTSPSQQINLLQPVNLINNASGVMPNFPAFQQFIVPNLGGMVMTADGTAIIQDNSTGMPMQLQLQTVNGQNVLTPVQNPGMFTTGPNGGVVIRAQNQQGKIIQSQHSPGAQFLSPNSQVMMNSPNFNGQLSPLLANLSPTNVTFNSAQVRPSNMQAQEFIQTNQIGQTLMVPLSPKQVSMATTTSRTNSTFVHQNTTIVQQQTTLVSNTPSQMSGIVSLQNGSQSRLSIDPSTISKQIPKSRHFDEDKRSDNEIIGDDSDQFGHIRHSVSTQTLVNQQSQQNQGQHSQQGQRGRCWGSPPDTTTHSPLGALEQPNSPRRPAYADTTTSSPEPSDAASSAMVQCVSSSEQDMAESRDHAWPSHTVAEYNTDHDAHNMISNIPMIRQNHPHNAVESTDIHYQNIPPTVNNQHIMPMTSNYYERPHGYKRKNDFGDGSSYRSDKIMRNNSYNTIHGVPKDGDYDSVSVNTQDKTQTRHYSSSGSSSDVSKVFERHSLGSGDDVKSSDEREQSTPPVERQFEVGQLVWGPARGHASWPGKLEAKHEQRWMVRWFGADKPPALVHQSRLLTLSEGLEAHHAARTKHRKSRKLNTLLENAIQEAMAELDKSCEDTSTREPACIEENPSDGEIITDTPKRSRKHDKGRNKDKHHKKNIKLASHSAKSGDNTRLRSAR